MEWQEGFQGIDQANSNARILVLEGGEEYRAPNLELARQRGMRPLSFGVWVEGLVCGRHRLPVVDFYEGGGAYPDEGFCVKRSRCFGTEGGWWERRLFFFNPVLSTSQTPQDPSTETLCGGRSTEPQGDRSAETLRNMNAMTKKQALVWIQNEIPCPTGFDWKAPK